MRIDGAYLDVPHRATVSLSPNYEYAGKKNQWRRPPSIKRRRQMAFPEQGYGRSATHMDPQEPSGSVLPREDGGRSVLAVVVGVGIILWFGPVGQWLAGRFYRTIDYAPLFLSVLVSLLLAVWVSVRTMRIAFSDRPAGERRRLARAPTIILLLIVLPWVVLQLNGFALGFASWVRASVDVQSVRQWVATVPVHAMQSTNWRPRWVDRRVDTRPYLQVPRSSWPDAIARLDPEGVYLAADRSYVVVVWWGGTWGYGPSLTVGASAGTPRPPTNKTWVAALHSVRPGVWVNVLPPSG